MYVDLHTHLRGTVTPELGRELAKKNGVQFPDGVLNESGNYYWTGFHSFLSRYDQVAQLVRTPSDLNAVAVAYLRRIATEGALYVEFMLSPLDLQNAGLPYADQISALRSAIDECRSLGVECRIVMTCVRHKGPSVAEATARLIASRPDPIVVGFGMTGDELAYDTNLFAPAFSIARSSGLRTTAHAGEHAGARAVEDAITHLRVDRIGHGVRAIEDPQILELLVSGPALEVCISSNVALQVYRGLDTHPLPSLLAAGCKITLATDDPAFFQTTPAAEYKLAERMLGYASDDMIAISRTAIDAAFCDDVTKELLRQRLLKSI